MTQSILLDGQPLIARCDPQHDLSAHSMLKKFAELHAAGPRFAPGTHIDFGWATLQIEADNAEWLVCEPDFDSEPLQWRPSVNQTLAVLEAQGHIMQQLGIAPTRTRGDQWLWLAPDALDAPAVYLTRTQANSPQESGWYIGNDRAGDDESNIQRAQQIRAGRLWLPKPEWVAMLALPVGYLVQMEEGRICAIYDDKDLCIFPATD